MSFRTLYYEFPAEDQLQFGRIARKWRREHFQHVEKLIRLAKKSYPPGGSDCLHPELWHPEHWRWFIENEG